MKPKWKVMSALVIAAIVLSVGAFVMMSDDQKGSSDAVPMNAGQRFVCDFNAFAYESTNNPDLIYATYSDGLITITIDPSQNSTDLTISVYDLISSLDGYTITLDGKTVLLDGSLQRTSDTISVMEDMVYQVESAIEGASDEGVYVLYTDNMTIHNDDLLVDFDGSINISICMDEDTITTLQDLLDIVHLDTSEGFSLTIDMTSGMASAVGSETAMDDMTVLEFLQALSNSDASELFGADVGEKIDGISNGILNTDPTSLDKVMSGVIYTWDADSVTYTVALDDDFEVSDTGTGFVALLNSIVENANASANGWEGIKLASMRSGNTYTFEGTLELTYVSGGSLKTLSLPFTINLVYPEHSVTYDVNGGSGSAPVQSSVAEGNTFTIANYSGTKTSYKFGGWSDGSKTYQPGDLYTMGTSDVTLDAIWNPAHYVGYTFNDGTFIYRITCIGAGDEQVAIVGTFVTSGALSLTSSVKYDGITYEVTSIGSFAFRGCTGITSITIPDSVTTISNDAFSGCTSITGTISLSKNVTSIGYYAFGNCGGSSFAVDPDNSNYKSANGLLLSKDGKTLIACLIGTTGSVTIPNTVTTIGDNAFYGCISITSVTIPDSVKTINPYAFIYCTGLISITIPDSVTTIGTHAFNSCSGLTSITIPDSVTSLGSVVFGGCTGLISVNIGDGITTINERTFEGCAGITSIVIPSNVTFVGKNAFYNCTGLTCITIESASTSLGQSVFYGINFYDKNGTTSLSQTSANLCGYTFKGTHTSMIKASQVKYEVDGGSDPAPAQFYLTINSTFIVASYSGTKSGYTFGGWNDGTNTYAAGSTYTMGASNVTLTAVWTAIPTHTVTYGVDGGSESAPTQSPVAEGSTFIVASYSGTKAGYTFGGWNDGTSTYTAGSTYTMSTSNVTLTAVWTSLPTHNVTYNVNGGSVSAPTQSPVAEGCTFIVASYSGTKAGYAFNGWNDGTNTYAAGSTYTMGTSNVTLTALWTAIPTHTVTYDVNGGSSPAPTQSDVAEGSTFIVASYSGTNAGYTFGGWNDGTNTYAAGSNYTMGTSNVTLTAVWIAIPTHTVTYRVNGGSEPAPIQLPVAEGDTFIVASYSGTMFDYTFDGWYDGSNRYDVGSTYTMGTSDVTLTAVWQKVYTYHNVTYDVNGGSDLEPVQAPVAEGSIFIVADYSGTKGGYTFDGWTDGTDHYAVGDIYTMGDSDVVLTAVWVSNADLDIISVAGSGGNITPNSLTVVKYHSNQAYVMMAHNNYKVLDVMVDGVSVGAINMYVFKDVTSNHTISVTFIRSEGARTWFDPSSGYIYEELNGTMGDGTVYTITRATSPSNEVTHTGVFTNEEQGVVTTVVDGMVYSVINLKATASGEIDVAELSDEQINVLLAQTIYVALEMPIDKLEISIDIADSGSSGVSSTSMVFSKDQLDVLKSFNLPIQITTKTGTVELDSNVIETLASYGEGLTITVGTVDKSQLNEEQQKKVGNNTIISAEAMVGSTVIHDLGGNVTVTMPYILKSGEDPDKVEIWYLDDQGNITEIDATYDPETQTVSFVTDHFSYYVVAFESPSTTPSSNNWIIYIAIIIVVILMLAFVVYHYKVKKTA